MSEHIKIHSDGSWEFIGEDSTLKSKKGQKVNYRVFNPITKEFEYRVMNQVFCRNCGADGGLSAQEAFYIHYICDKCWGDGSRWAGEYIPMLPTEESAWRNGIKSD